jgi:murein DD-endopeptidase MepM/ murein hydrolase activator NlpD
MSYPLEPKSPFLHYLTADNRPHLDNFQRWLFLPGMLFQSLEKWWGDQGRRLTPHEGLDLCTFEEVNGKKQTLDRHTKIPAAFAGEIVKIAPDFLGQSIFLGHGIFDDCGRQLYSAYGHTLPRDSLQMGAKVAAGETIGTITDFSDKKLSILPHLHISIAWIPKAIAPQELNWANLGSNADITLIDPLAVLELDSL